MTAVALLGAELTHKTIWNPTILGVLVFISALGLFCGSVYLLLATNLGARLGFYVAASCLTGFLVLLSLLWMTTATPLNSPKGRESKWVMKEVVTNPSDAKIKAVDKITTAGKELSLSDLANIRPAVDAAFVAPTSTVDAEGNPITPSPFQRFGLSSDFITGEQGLKAYQMGGGTKNVFWHNPTYAAVEYCNVKVKPADVPFGEKPPTPSCDPLVPHQFAILERDLGSIRQPPVMFFLAFAALFGLSLLGLHWYELDQREAKRRAATPVPVS